MTAPVAGADSEHSTPRVEEPIQRARAESQNAEARPSAPPAATESRSTSTAPARSVFVLESDEPAVHIARTQPEAQVAAKPEPSGKPAPQPSPTPAETSAQPIAPAQAFGRASGRESGDSGARREALERRAEPAPAAESGAPRDATTNQSPAIGLKPAPALGEGAALPSSKPIAQSAPPEAQVVAQSVARGLSAAVNQRGGSVTLRLVPESLGLVRIHMSIDQGVVNVRLEATNQAAQGLLTEHIAMLRGSLESRGLTVEKLSVQFAPATSLAGAGLSHGAGHNSAGANQQQQSPLSDDQQASWHDAAGGQSRGRRDGEQEGQRDEARGRLADVQGDAHNGTARHADKFGGRLRLRLETVA